jgi:DNA repair exonuclease SbcCD ATPase subunit
MVKFNKVRWKNFFATGNAWNEIVLDATRTTLITGQNGAGKSTMLEAIYFALFGKPYRSINKGQILNSINQKNCIVELEFETNGSQYKIIRGIKPNIFEIYCNDKLLTQDAAVKDYQKILEEQIVKYNAKTFTQVVVLGSASFTPFMQLQAAHRREVFDDVLDIGIFTRMNEILKKQYKDLKDEITKNGSFIDRKKDNIEAQEKLINYIEQNKEREVAEREQEIVDIEVNIKQKTDSIADLTKVVEELTPKTSEYKEYVSRSEKAKSMLIKTSTAQESILNKVNFFKSHDVCPECSQDINSEHKQSIIENLNHNMTDHNAKAQILNEALVKMKTSINTMESILDQIRRLNIEISTATGNIMQYNQRISDIRKKIAQLKSESSDIDKEKDKLKQMKAELISLEDEKAKFLDQKAVQEQAILLLKDTGIKTSIIKEYLPVMNKLINKYLAQMDFFVNFEIDESFSEVIKSRNRDEFSYTSFSEGEKQRIDLAIMFTFRVIAQMKNSLNTNLLILDEIFSSSLDQAAVEFLTEMLTNSLENTNVFVITHHPDQFIDSFDRHIQFEKKNDFSVIKE